MEAEYLEEQLSYSHLFAGQRARILHDGIFLPAAFSKDSLPDLPR